MTRRTDLGRWFRRSLIAASLSLALVSLSAWAEGPTLNETGSTLLYPLFQRWIPDYTRLVPGITITAAATGSGTGIAAAISGDAHIGASDAYMSDEQAEQNTGIVNIPLAISAQTVNYNIPGLNDAGLKLDGPTLASIYDGRIKEWDAAPIAELNPACRTAAPADRADPPIGCLGRYLHLYAVPGFLNPELGEPHRLRHQHRLARGSWRKNRQRQ